MTDGQLSLFTEEKTEHSEATELIPNTIDVTFSYQKYENKDNGYCVCIYKDVNTNKTITCSGYFLPSTKGITFTMYGKWGSYKGSPQFIVESSLPKVEKTEASIITYLSCGIIKGIGKATAKKIWDTFGSDTLTILDRDTSRLEEVKGIKKKTRKKIAESYEESRCARDIILEGSQLDVSSSLCLKIYHQYKEKSIGMLKEHPYLIIKDVKGFTFPLAERIAKKLGLSEKDDERFDACVDYIFGFFQTNQGGTGVTLYDFGNKIYELIGSSEITKEYLSEQTCVKVKKGDIKVKKMKVDGEERKCLFPANLYKVEEKCASNIIRIKEMPNNLESEVTDAIINEALSDWGIKLDTLQIEAIKTSLNSSLSIITGAPGVGKTTVIKGIIKTFERDASVTNDWQSVILMAPTGRAARKMSEATGMRARTIHKALKIRPDADQNDIEPIRDALIIVDEFSMVDSYLARILFENIEDGCKVVLVGDSDQLPSVGCGAVLRDIIDSGIVPVTKLTHVHRQDNDTSIYTNIVKISRGEKDLIADESFRFIEDNNIDSIQSKMIEETVNAVCKYGIDNVYCLAPFKKHSAGVDALNQALRERLNPANGIKKEYHIGKSLVTYREGDKVMYLVNDEDASNGDIGYITRIEGDSDGISVFVEINDTEIELCTKDDFDKITLAYAFTIHKAQGGEAKCVITCLCDFHRFFFARNIPYTSFSRAREEVVFIGKREALNTAINNEAINNRITSLNYWIQYLSGECWIGV